MVIIKDGAIVENEWRHIADDESLPEGKASVSLQRWVAERRELAGRKSGLGLRLTAADGPEEISGDLGHFELIVLEMAHFADGRVFSTARLLRERYGYTGELRVRGDYLRDQMFYLERVGVNAFELGQGVDPDLMLPAFGELSVRYQAATDERKPLYRRRR